jgi:phospholipase C
MNARLGATIGVLLIAVDACATREVGPPTAAAVSRSSVAHGKSPNRKPADATPTPSPSPTPTPFRPVQHVVIIIQENRSFDNLFNGFPGADTVQAGSTSTGGTVALQPTSLTAPFDLGHHFGNFLFEYDNGKMDGFDLETAHPLPRHTAPPANFAYAYVPQAETGPYWSLASQYVLADNAFASQPSASFPSHQYLIAAQAGGTGQSGAAVDNPAATPWGCDGTRNGVLTLNADRTYGPRIRPCFTYLTLADELEAKGLSWRSYAPVVNNRIRSGYQWSAFDAIRDVRETTRWPNHVRSPQTQFLADVQSGSLAAVTWVVPDFIDSDHGGSASASGPQWVANVVNVVGTSAFWSTTTIFVVWDDWGGWYDHVPPPQLDYDGLGIRVPLIVVSPYAKAGYVSHVQYEFGSILRFVEDNWHLPQLAASDARATSPSADCFDFTQAPRAFSPIQTSMRRSDFLHRRPSLEAPDY